MNEQELKELKKECAEAMRVIADYFYQVSAGMNEEINYTSFEYNGENCVKNYTLFFNPATDGHDLIISNI